MILSFQDFLLENVPIDKFEDESGANHMAWGDRHQIMVSYSRHKDTPDKKAYQMDFALNGSYHDGGAKDEHSRALVADVVKRSMHEFIKDHNPDELHFAGSSSKKHYYWGKMGPAMAKRLGATFEAGSEDPKTLTRTSHVMRFQKK